MCFLAASTDVERSFSQGRLNVSRLRHSLSDESTRSATVFGSWVQECLVQDDNLIEHIRQKAYRSVKGKIHHSDSDIESVYNSDTEHLVSDIG